jgi:hypothetical protein
MSLEKWQKKFDELFPDGCTVTVVLPADTPESTDGPTVACARIMVRDYDEASDTPFVEFPLLDGTKTLATWVNGVKPYKNGGRYILSSRGEDEQFLLAPIREESLKQLASQARHEQWIYA